MGTTKKKAGAKKAAASKPVGQTKQAKPTKQAKQTKQAKATKQAKQTGAAKATGRRATQRLGASARPTQRKSKTRVLKKEQPVAAAPKEVAASIAPVASSQPITPVVKPAPAPAAAAQEVAPAPVVSAPAKPTSASGTRPRGEVLRFDPARLAPLEDEWISVVYDGSELFVHAEAGVFARGTRTRLRRAVAEQLRDTRGFRLLKAG